MVEPGETSEYAAVREVAEELGLTVRIIDELGSQEFVEDEQTYRYTWHRGVETSGTPQICEPETFDDLRYFSLQELVTLRSAGALSPNARNFVNQLSTGAITLA